MSDIKPPVPTQPGDPWPRLSIDDSEGSPFEYILRAALYAVDAWNSGPDGARSHPEMTPGQRTEGEVREALLHLLELGVIDIDVDRLRAATSLPGRRTSA